MNKRRIIVLGGGRSLERDVSLRSSKEIIRALNENGYKVDFIDPSQSNEYLNAGVGDIIFPILHGEFGEDGEVQAMLENKGLAFLGTGSKASKNCFDKYLTRSILEANSLPIARGEMVDKGAYLNSKFSKKPHVLKAVSGGSSIGTAIVRSVEESDKQAIIKEVFSVSPRAVIEELVEGVEITVPIFDNRPLPVIEIRPPENEEFDYQNKYNGKTQELCPPVSISAVQQRTAQDLALKSHQVLECRHLSRVDIIVKPNGEMVLLEINTMPGMTDQSLYPKSAAYAGISFKGLAKMFVELVERDFKFGAISSK